MDSEIADAQLACGALLQGLDQLIDMRSIIQGRYRPEFDLIILEKGETICSALDLALRPGALESHIFSLLEMCSSINIKIRNRAIWSREHGFEDYTYCIYNPTGKIIAFLNSDDLLESKKDIDVLTRFEKLARMQKDMGLENSIGTSIDELIQKAMTSLASNTSESKKAMQNATQTLENIEPPLQKESQEPQISLKEHHKIVDGLEREFSDLAYEKEEAEAVAEAEKRVTKKRIVDLERELSDLKHSREETEAEKGIMKQRIVELEAQIELLADHATIAKALLTRPNPSVANPSTSVHGKDLPKLPNHMNVQALRKAMASTAARHDTSRSPFQAKDSQVSNEATSIAGFTPSSSDATTSGSVCGSDDSGDELFCVPKKYREALAHLSGYEIKGDSVGLLHKGKNKQDMTVSDTTREHIVQGNKALRGNNRPISEYSFTESAEGYPSNVDVTVRDSWFR